MLVFEAQKLRFTQADSKLTGRAIEASFRPMPGLVSGFLSLGGNGIRWVWKAVTGWMIPPNYHSLLGKLIAWAPTRAEAIRKLKRALAETAVQSVPTTIPFHLEVLEKDTFQDVSEIYTSFNESEGILDALKDERKS